jgi:phospholipase C
MTLTSAFRPPMAICRRRPSWRGNVNTFQPSLGGVIIGVPTQEKGIRPAHALPYELDARGTVNASNSTLGLMFRNTGKATVVFQVRSANAADPVRNYTIGDPAGASDRRHRAR